jgi:UDP-3-O-[3-hydroxymyristoyl] glucosamine N-acyltransferase
VGLAGSVTVGNRVMFGGKSGVKDHVTIGDDAKLYAASVALGNVKAGESVWGYPAREIHSARREAASLAYLPGLLQRVRALEARLQRRAVRRK